MQSKDVLRRHANLVDRMATARGVDLEESILRGKMHIPELDDAVLSCTGCTRPGDCSQWLASKDSFSDTTPGYCRNSELFARLAAE